MLHRFEPRLAVFGSLPLPLRVQAAFIRPSVTTIMSRIFESFSEEFRS